MTTHLKQNALVVFLISTIAIVLLSLSLSSLQLHAGIPVYQEGSSNTSIQSVPELIPLNLSTINGPKSIFAILFIVLSIFFLVRVIILICRNLPIMSWLAKMLLPIMSVVALLYLFNQITPPDSKPAAIEPINILDQPALQPSIMQLNGPPQALRWAVVAASLLAIGIIVFIKIKGRSQGNFEKNQLLNEAENALAALNAGADFKNVIIRCYHQMSMILKQNRGVERYNSMTVREFEKMLQEKGIPYTPIHHLSSLFELVRYGKYRVTRADENKGIESLNEIIHYCRKMKK